MKWVKLSKRRWTLRVSSLYPQLPFASHSWRLSHHTGAVDETLLYQLLLAASMHLTSSDPAQDVTSYLVSNGLLPANVRTDSGQADVWRDYQQVLSETGLMFSTRSGKSIRFTPTGLAYLDHTSSKRDILTIQAFRWQYPNGHNTQKSRGDRSVLDFAEQQMAHGVLLRPAVLVFDVLNSMERDGFAANLSASELEAFLIPARSHSETEIALAALQTHRTNPKRLVKNDARRRNALDWIVRLSRTHAFQQNDDKTLSLSRFARENSVELQNVMEHLKSDCQWWIAPTSSSISESWYQWYGTQDSERYPIPSSHPATDPLEPGEEAANDELSTSMTLRRYERTADVHRDASLTVATAYSADLSESAHRLHDTMVRLIAEKCITNGGQVFYDPQTVDLLIQFASKELLLEVKSATSANFVRKVRMAIGQVAHYDFLRSKQTSSIRRKALALTLDIPPQHWTREFVCDYLNMDLISLKAGALSIYSSDADVQALLR